MNLEDFHDAKTNFDAEAITKKRQQLHSIRKRFVRDFAPKKIESLTVKEFVENVKESRESFCYRIEVEQAPLGLINGSTCQKFGFYYSKKRDKIEWVKRLGNSKKESFTRIKSEIAKLLEDGKNENYEGIKESLISEMFKSKILCVYYPDKYLNVFSTEHVNYFLKAFDLDTPDLMKKDPIEKRKALIDFKNNDKEMKKWPIDTFSYFLYNVYPKAPKKDKIDNVFDFPTVKVDDNIWINNTTIDTKSSHLVNKKDGKIAPSPNYDKESRKYKLMGDRGEKIVLEAERKRVMKELGLNKKEVEAKVIRKSLESDSYGYDILSLENDGSPRYIEVKATNGNPGDTTFFYTINELETAMKYGNNYYIYIVYSIKNKNPKIWIIQNPFMNNELKLEPIKFKVHVKTRKI